jgi:hypothetical protein
MVTFNQEDNSPPDIFCLAIQFLEHFINTIPNNWRKIMILDVISSLIHYNYANKQNVGEDEQAAIVGMFNDLKDLTSGPRSIASESKKSLFQYPFLVSSNVVSLDNISGIIKGCEVEYMNMIILMAGVDPTANGKYGVQISRRLSKFHTTGTDYSMEMESAGINTLSIDQSWKKANGVAYEAPGAIPTGPQIDDMDDLDDVKGVAKDLADRLRTPENPKGLLSSMKAINSKYANLYNMTLVDITLRLEADSETTVQIPIGIKGIPHHLPYDELIYVMNRYITHKTQGFINRFIRWTSGELKGIHNLLLRYDEIKADINYEKRVGTSNSWIKVLRSRANNHKVNILARALGRAGGKNVKNADVLPDCTFVISLGDVDRIEQQTGVNLFTNPGMAAKFLNESMALGLIIVDEVHEIVHVLFSSYNKYTSTPIKAFASKNKSSGDEAKLLIDLMKRI